MSVSTLHGLYAVEAGSAVIGGIVQCALATGTDIRADAANGEVYARNQSVIAQKVGGSFTSMAIQDALDVIPVLGKSIAALTGGLKVYAQQHAEGGTRTTGSNHRKFTILEGLIVPRTLTVQHQQDAQLPFDILATYDGTNDPVQIADGAALPTPLVDNERFTLGKVTIGSIVFTHVRSVEIEFGINAVTEGADSDVWDTFSSIRAIAPSITIRGVDASWLKSSNVPLTGLAGTHANTSIYLRKRSAAGFVADGTAEHIKFTVDGYAVVDAILDASGSEPGETAIRMPLRYDGTNAPILVNTAIAIT